MKSRRSRNRGRVRRQGKKRVEEAEKEKEDTQKERVEEAEKEKEDTQKERVEEAEKVRA